ncbi:MAG: hypothetical protein ABIG69_09155 [Bacteroidota bacterium]
MKSIANKIGLKYVLLFSFLCSFLFFGCESYILHREIKKINEISSSLSNEYYLKIHTLSGKIYLMNNWVIDDEKQEVHGKGGLYNINRELEATDTFAISYDQVVLAETNRLDNSTIAGGLTFLTVISAGLSGYCLINPKACFGSCPTFYAWDGQKMELQAEGFSASIARALEAKDIDHLYSAKPECEDFQIRVTNEALETHFIREVNLLAAKHGENNRTYLTSSMEYFETSGEFLPVAAQSESGDILNKIKFINDDEYYSLTDSSDLAEKEELFLTFDDLPAGNKGLLIGFRQTLLTTYLFYQAIAYMGNSYSYILSMIETGDSGIQNTVSEFFTNLGGIEVYALDKNKRWIKVEEIFETGPIARNLMMVKLPDEISYPVNLKLVMAKGMWRIDYSALTSIIKAVQPVRLAPVAVYNDGTLDEGAKNSLLDSSKTLLTLPGDEYEIHYILPDDYSNYGYFLETQGYYYE